MEFLFIFKRFHRRGCREKCWLAVQYNDAPVASIRGGRGGCHHRSGPRLSSRLNVFMEYRFVEIFDCAVFHCASLQILSDCSLQHEMYGNNPYVEAGIMTFRAFLVKSRF